VWHSNVEYDINAFILNENILEMFRFFRTTKCYHSVSRGEGIADNLKLFLRLQ
jgi:hypothetical protein